jgi:hypothetical protein
MNFNASISVAAPLGSFVLFRPRFAPAWLAMMVSPVKKEYRLRDRGNRLQLRALAERR